MHPEALLRSHRPRCGPSASPNPQRRLSITAPSQRNACSSNNALMGCIPSKQKVLDGDSSTTILSATAEKGHKKQKRSLASPVIPDDAPPWVRGAHRVMSHQDGSIIISERVRS
ncbi:hypothetical protein BD413DRAFT_508271 [Trametes elegans]|nr:hypothetical protein BD413DRAFT_508271 [Trametes elegans]